jgi:hypothetical protein
MDSAPVYAVNRELIASDLDRIASSLSPLIVFQMASFVETMAEAVMVADLPAGLRAGWMRSLLARLIRDRGSRLLPASVAPQLSTALRGLLELSDADLTTLCEATATELGAWVGAVEPVSGERLAAALAPLGRRIGADG